MNVWAKSAIVASSLVVAAAGLGMVVGVPSVPGTATPNAAAVQEVVCDAKYDDVLAVYDRLPQIGSDWAVVIGLAQFSSDAALVRQENADWQADLDRWTADLEATGYADQCSGQAGAGELATVSTSAKAMLDEVDRTETLNNGGKVVTVFDLNDRIEDLKAALAGAHQAS